jgi:hypothetical protein
MDQDFTIGPQVTITKPKPNKNNRDPNSVTGKFYQTSI